jgi:hypothetical protein
MKRGIVLLVLGALALTAASAASARVHVNVNVNPFGYEYAQPVIYQGDPYYDPYYAAPPVAYFGRGSWGGGRERRSEDRAGRGERHSRGHDDRGGDHHH